MADTILFSAIGLVGIISLVLVVLILTQKHRHENKENKVRIARDYLFDKYIDGKDVTLTISERFFFDALIDVDEQMHIDNEVRQRIMEDVCSMRFLKKQNKRLHSRISFRRKMAIFYLGRVRKKEAYENLYGRFLKEKNETVKLHIVMQLRYGMEGPWMNAIMESLIGASDIYHERLCTVLGSNYKRLYDYLEDYRADTRYEIVLALVRMGQFHTDSFLHDYMLDTLDDFYFGSRYAPARIDKIKRQILNNLKLLTPEVLCDDKYFLHDDLIVREYAMLAIAQVNKKQDLGRLVKAMDKTSLDQTIVIALSKMVYERRERLNDLLTIFERVDAYKQARLIEVFGQRIDYILLKVDYFTDATLIKILRGLFEAHIIEPLIDFINQNPDIKIERFVMGFLLDHAKTYPKGYEEFCLYVQPKILKRYAIIPKKAVRAPRRKLPIEKRKVRWLMKWLVINFLTFPLIFVVRMNTALLSMSLSELIVRFVVDVNIYLIFYFVIINTIYIFLLILAIIGSKKQVRLAHIKKNALLFTDKLLPGISIIAPAYNEEMSIIESVTSLLNLKYPNYEVIVVNDGSKDLTLKRLISHFKLERKHPTFALPLSTKAIRGFYMTKSIPNLVVIDKDNGGKADALNLGINASRMAYVCGIDADSVLEGDALLKLMSVTLDDTKPFIALGGNIYPANGFRFEQGKVKSRGLPKEHLARFQSIEYMRAFTSGRIGWSELRSLMIISGAFGLFNRAALVKTGGYLTSSGIHQKDTVGEDMELVVRLTYNALKEKSPFRVQYVHNAYCYTELPSDINTLRKQRNRWQRGLIDILSYHRGLAFRPRYKQIGFIGYPYFFMFEFMGPFFEAQGYLMLVFALIFGLVSPTIVLGIFTASIGFGVMISLASVFMIEREVLMLSRKETIMLILYAILENFGYRQMLSLQRTVSTFSALRESGQWGAQKRKGFQK